MSNLNKKSDELIREKIAVIGTGNYGIAIGKRLLDYGFDVVFGSRHPNFSYIKNCLNSDSFEVTKIAEALHKSHKFVFLAISSKNYESFLDEILNQNEKSTDMSSTVVDTKSKKIFIELSNLSDDQTGQNTKISNAEKLQSLLASRLNKMDNIKHLNEAICVVKGFNMVNAYSMAVNYGDEKGNSETIPIAGDDISSKKLVIDLANRIGFQAVDIGPLKNSLKLELSNKKTFEDWKYPALISAIFVLLNYLWIFLMYFFFPKKPHTFEKFIKSFSPLGHLNKVLGFSALQILAFVYLASIFASIYQLKYRTKYKRFPKYLDYWLKTRKQFGLLAFLIATVHAIASLITLGPQYLETWYRYGEQDTNKFNLTKLTLHGEINMITGFSAYILLALMALSSVNSIAASLNWSEWRFVQSKLGVFSLFVGLLHAISMYLNIYLNKDKFSYSTVYLLTRVKLISIYFPIIVVILRIMFSYFPPLSKRLEKIRDGTLVVQSV